jgi:hypothetical protein
MERRYQGVLKFKRFFGVKAGRSVWRESFVKTHVYVNPSVARYELEWLRDYVIPATGASVVGYYVDAFFDMDENLPL